MDTCAVIEDLMPRWCCFLGLLWALKPSLLCFSVVFLQDCLKLPSPPLACTPSCTTHPLQFSICGFWPIIPSAHAAFSQNPHILLDSLLLAFPSSYRLSCPNDLLPYFCSTPSFKFLFPLCNLCVPVKKGSFPSPPAPSHHISA